LESHTAAIRVGAFCGRQQLTLAETNPQMAELKPLAAESLTAAEREIDAQWAPVAA
jgi:hypothetical protein